MTLEKWVEIHGSKARRELAKKCGKTDAFFRMLAMPGSKYRPSPGLAPKIAEATCNSVTILEALYPHNPELWGKK